MKTFKVYYMKPEWFREGICYQKPTGDISKTHTFLKDVEAFDLEEVFHKMQGEVWSPNGEARSLIREKGLGHTSMSVGDIVVDDDNKIWIAAMFGFDELKDCIVPC